MKKLFVWLLITTFEEVIYFINFIKGGGANEIF
jgi:hypothetical protein